MKTRQITLPADVFDTLELVAEAYGGIGASNYMKPVLSGSELVDFEPYCIHGACKFAVEQDQQYTVGPELRGALYDRGIHEGENDKAVKRINRRRGGGSLNRRVPFSLWTKELNVVRGDA